MLFGKKSKDGDAGVVPEKKAAPPPAQDAAAAESPEAGKTTQLPPEEVRRRAAVSKHLAATFGEIVSLLMRIPQFKALTLADLEWLVVPALLAGQFSIANAQSKISGASAPVGLVLWARVSPEVDRRLTEAAGQPIRLSPKEWTSGEILWVISAIGDQRILQGMLQRLQEKDWAQKPVKIMSRAKDGKPAVSILGMKAA